jgi:hypothetical protein
MELRDAPVSPSNDQGQTILARRGHSELPPPDVFDPVVEAYKKDVDRTLLIENLKLTPEERCDKFLRFMEMVYEIRRAGDKMRASTSDQ